MLDLLRHLVVPALALALPLAAMFERLQAEAMHEVLAQPYVVAALARGVPRSRVLWRDALKAALVPVAPVYGLVVGTLLSGSFVVEIITTWPGLGRLMLEALRARDVYLVAGCAATGSLFLAAGRCCRTRRSRWSIRGRGMSTRRSSALHPMPAAPACRPGAPGRGADRGDGGAGAGALGARPGSST